MVLWSCISSFLETHDLLHLLFLNHDFQSFLEETAFRHLFYQRCTSRFQTHVEMELLLGTTDEKEAYSAIYLLFHTTRSSYLRSVSFPFHKQQCSFQVYTHIERLYHHLTNPDTLSWFVQEFGPPPRLFHVCWWMHTYSTLWGRLLFDQKTCVWHLVQSLDK